MQIGALPPGASTLTPLPAGPALQPGFLTSTPPTPVQQVTAASSSAAPASFAATIAASQAGSLLIALVTYTPTAAPTVTAPAGFTQIASGDSTVRGMGGRLYVRANNPGGITSVGVTGLTNINSVAIAVYELTNVGAVYSAISNTLLQTFNFGGSTASLAQTPPAAAMYWVGCEAGISTGALTNNGSGFLVAGTVATSTTGATNVTIRPYAGQAPAQLAAVTMGGTDTANAGCLLVGILTYESAQYALGASRAVVADQGAGYAAGDAGSGGWSLGGTKPGGAGGGQ